MTTRSCREAAYGSPARSSVPTTSCAAKASAGDGFALAQDGELSVALDTALDDELLREGRARELIHHINAMRRDLEMELTDRIVVTLRPEDADLLEYEDWIKEETLALEVSAGNALAIQKA